MAHPVITRDDAIAWLEAYKRAWETRDSDLIVSLFDPHCLYQETRFRPPFVGHTGLRTYWDNDVVARQRDVSFAFTLWAVDGPVAYAHWRCVLMDLKKNAQRTVDGVFRLTFAGRGPAGLLCGVLDEWWNVTPAE